MTVDFKTTSLRESIEPTTPWIYPGFGNVYIFFVCGIWQSFHRIYMHIISMCISLIINSKKMRDLRGRGDRVVVGFTSTHVIGALHHHSWWFFWWSLESMRDFFQTLQPQKIKIGVNTVLG